MLDLNTIFGTREQLLPQEGFWGFLLDNWLTVAVVMMILGFVIDQVLYIVRYRPQDKFVRLRRAVEKIFLKNAEPLPLEEDFEEEPVVEKVVPAVEKKVIETKHEPAASEDADAPVIRRGGAKYAPKPDPEVEEPVFSSPRKQIHEELVYTPPKQSEPEEPVYTPPKRLEPDDEKPVVVRRDKDAPMVVRAPAKPVRSRSAEPDTQRGKPMNQE